MTTRKEIDTDNIQSWVLNNEGLYLSACNYMKSKRHSKTAPYRNWIRRAGLEGDHTMDGTRFDSHSLDYRELNDMMKSLLD
jgi:hypothetical protein